MAGFVTGQRVRLADLGEFRNGVNFGKGKKGCGLGLINVKDIFRDSPKVDFESLDSVDLADSRGIENFFVEAGDLFFVRSSVKRDGIGFVAYSNKKNHDAVHCGFVIRFRPYKQKVDSRFLTYALRSPDNRERIRNLSGGAAITNISQESLCTLLLHIPLLPMQQRIASVLSAYDELIENNQRRIQILETMARALYREWFVEFRFPGHDKIPRVASPLGDIPQGWEVKKVGDIAENIRRNVPKGDLAVPRPYVGLEHIPRRSLALDAWEMTTELGSNKLEFRKGEVIFGKVRPYFHKVSVSPFDGVCSADTIVIRARRPEDYAFMVACVSSDAFVAHASATANGSKMPRANWDVLEKYEVVIPQGKVIRHFSALLVGILAQEQTLMFQIHNLRSTRDLLLPRLLSGQVTLTDTAA